MDNVRSNAHGDRPHAIIIGGGATGCGIARDLILRGIRVTLIEFGDLGSGTSSRFHGMLQSGARYAVSDTEYAAECMAERRIIANLVPEAVEQTGGLFVSLRDDPADYPDAFLSGCHKAGIPAEELDPEQTMQDEPNISREIIRSFSVPDATIQSWRLVNILADDVRRRGGTILTRHRVSAIKTAGGRVSGVQVEREGSEYFVAGDVVINATGAWSARVAAMVGQGIDLELAKGSIIVFSHRLVSQAVNRCRPPQSHDIVVPTGSVSLFGTTSEVVDNPDTTHVRPEEIQELLDNAEPLIPDIRKYRAFRAWAGVRPLYIPKSRPVGVPLPRRHSTFDHSDQGVEGFVSVCGGSLTTHRSMAEDVGNVICAHLGLSARCISASTPIASGEKQPDWQPVRDFQRLEESGSPQVAICECELVAGADVANLIVEHQLTHLHDIRRRLRVGFGPCQGTFCGSRVASMLAQHHPDYSGQSDLTGFWTERLKGSMRTAWGQQARQSMLSDAVYRENLGLRLNADNLPEEDKR